MKIWCDFVRWKGTRDLNLPRRIKQLCCFYFNMYLNKEENHFNQLESFNIVVCIDSAQHTSTDSFRLLIYINFTLRAAPLQFCFDKVHKKCMPLLQQNSRGRSQRRSVTTWFCAWRCLAPYSSFANNSDLLPAVAPVCVEIWRIRTWSRPRTKTQSDLHWKRPFRVCRYLYKPVFNSTKFELNWADLTFFSLLCIGLLDGCDTVVDKDLPDI